MVKTQSVNHKDICDITCEAVTRRDGGFKRDVLQEGKNKGFGDEKVSCAFVDEDIMSGCCHSVEEINNLPLCEGTNSTVLPSISS